MTIEFRMCKADLNFEVDFRVNGAESRFTLFCHIGDPDVIGPLPTSIVSQGTHVANIYNWYDCDQVGSYCIRIMHRFHP